MTEPIQLLKKRFNEIDFMYKQCIKNRDDISEIEKIRTRYKDAIFMLEYFGFSVPKSHKNHISVKSYNNKLHEKEVLDIRENCILGLHKKRMFGTSYYAKKYGVSRTTIQNIVNGKSHSKIGT